MTYVDSRGTPPTSRRTTYQRHLAILRDRFGWPTLDEHSYDALRDGSQRSIEGALATFRPYLAGFR